MLVFDYRFIVLFIGFIFLFENDQKKAITRRYRITQEFGLTHFNAKTSIVCYA